MPIIQRATITNFASDHEITGFDGEFVSVLPLVEWLGALTLLFMLSVLAVLLAVSFWPLMEWSGAELFTVLMELGAVEESALSALPRELLFVNPLSCVWVMESAVA